MLLPFDGAPKGDWSRATGYAARWMAALMIVTRSVLLVGTAVGVVSYWVDSYVRGGVHVTAEDWYIRRPLD